MSVSAIVTTGKLGGAQSSIRLHLMIGLGVVALLAVGLGG